MEFLRELDPPEDVSVSVAGHLLSVTVAGRARTTVRTSTGHLADRVAALGGSLRITVASGRATMRLLLPAPSDSSGLLSIAEPIGAEG